MRKAGRLRDRQEEPSVAQADGVHLAGSSELLQREIADRLEHPETNLAVADKALLDERLERVEIGACNLLRRPERAASGEDRQPGKERLLGFCEQVVAPLDRCPQRRLAGIGVPAAGKEIEPVGKPLENLSGREHAHP